MLTILNLKLVFEVFLPKWDLILNIFPPSCKYIDPKYIIGGIFVKSGSMVCTLEVN